MGVAVPMKGTLREAEDRVILSMSDIFSIKVPEGEERENEEETIFGK